MRKENLPPDNRNIRESARGAYMKSKSIRAAVVSAFVFVSPVLTFAASQPKVRMAGKSETQNAGDVTRAVQQGKGSGLTRRYDVALPTSAGHVNHADSAFRR
jgi:hypothetical protein